MSPLGDSLAGVAVANIKSRLNASSSGRRGSGAAIRAAVRTAATLYSLPIEGGRKSALHVDFTDRSEFERDLFQSFQLLSSLIVASPVQILAPTLLMLLRI